MNNDEISNICLMVQTTYPHYFEGYDDRKKRAIQKVWNAVLVDYDYQTVCAGLKVYMANDVKGVPPVPGQIIEQIQRFRRSENNLTEDEAWKLVYKAICNGIYGAEKEYRKLPEIIQKAVGSPDMIRRWAVDPNVNNTHQYFERLYRTTYRRYQEESRVPESVRILLGNTAERTITEIN